MKQRSLYLDLVKGLTIFLVIWGHCFQYGTSYTLNNAYFENPLFQLIYSFHMPLFMLISGYFFFSSTQKLTIKENFINKINHLVIPSFCGGIIYFVLDKLLFNDIISLFDLVKSFIWYMCFGVWFLWAVFFSVTLILLNRKIFNDNFIFYILVFIFLLCMPNIYNMHYYTYMFPYFLVGYFWRKYNLSSKIECLNTKLKLFTSLFFVILFIFTFKFFSEDDFIYTTGTFVLQSKFPYLDYTQLWIDFYRYIVGFLGSIVILILIKVITNLKFITPDCFFTRTFSLLGMNTLGLYVISGIFNRFLEYSQLSFIRNEHYCYVFSFFESILILVLTLYLIKLISLNKISKKYLLGK